MKFRANWKYPINIMPGEFCSKFLTALRDEKKIMGSKCPKCNKVFVPPRASCEQCFGPIKDWVAVGPRAKLKASPWSATRSRICRLSRLMCWP